MNLLFVSATSTVLCLLVMLAFKYLSLLRWISGHAYVLSKGKETFSILEVLDLFKNVRPFPISCQKGWKIDSYANGHRIWFNFLTIPHNANAPSIKVYAVFGRIQSSSQGLLHVLKDTSQSCEWKPGVISTSHSHCHTSNGKSHCRGLPSVPVQVDCVKEERLTRSETIFDLPWPDRWYNENVIHTKSVEYKRFWHREDNGVCWLLQMNEKLQTCEFFLIQPVQELSQCLVTIVTWSQTHSEKSVQWASILLSALEEHISLRRLQKTPLTTITLPQDLSESQGDSSEDNQRHESFGHELPPSRKKDTTHSSSNSSSSHELRRSQSSNAELKRFSSILRFQSQTGSLPRNLKIAGSANSSPSPNQTSAHAGDTEELRDDVSCTHNGHRVLQRSVSDGKAVRMSRHMNQDLERMNQESLEEPREEDEYDDDEDEGEDVQQDDQNVSDKDIEEAQYKTISNQCAADIMAEALKASNINLEFTSEQQAMSSGGWFFSSFDKNIVVLKKNQIEGSSLQSYIGKGFVLAPPKTVWDAVRNPRTRFTYDETLKKVDILGTVGSTMKIVYLYHESVQFLAKETYDLCILQGERQEGEKYILTYSSIENSRCEPRPDTTRAKLLPSGWIIEPAKQDNKIYSIVTYVMQVDFGPAKSNTDKLPFQDMISRHPLSIADLQKYLKPAVQLLRRKSMPSAQV